MSILSMPDLILRTILDQLGVFSQYELQGVCKRFMNVMPFTTVDLSATKSHSWKAWRSVYKNCSALAHLVPVDRCRCLVASFEQSASLGSQLVLTVPGISVLVLPSNSLSLVELSEFPHLKLVTVLKLLHAEQKVSETCRATLDRLVSLNVLWGIPVQVLRNLCTLPVPCIQSLTVRGRLARRDVAMMRDKLPRLRHLKCAHGCAPSLLWFGEMRRLAWRSSDPKAIGGGFPATLVSLGIPYSKTPGASFGFFTALAGLTSLTVRLKYFDVASFQLLPNVRYLTYLDVTRTAAVSDDLLAVLMDAEARIHTLLAGNTPSSDGFTSEALAGYLEWAEWLEQLDVADHHRVTDALFAAPGAYVWTLRLLVLSGTGITKDGVTVFNAARDALAVEGRTLRPVKIVGDFRIEPCKQVFDRSVF